MKDFKAFLTEDKHSAGTYVEVLPALSSALELYNYVAGCEEIEDPSHYGKYHTTVIYSRTPVPEADNYRYTLPITGIITGWDIFGECLVALIHCPELTRFNSDLMMLGASSDYPTYRPHITVSTKYKRDVVPIKYPQMKITYDLHRVMGFDPSWK